MVGPQRTIDTIMLEFVSSFSAPELIWREGGFSQQSAMYCDVHGPLPQFEIDGTIIALLGII